MSFSSRPRAALTPSAFPGRYPVKPGFTLVELLIVVAIIAVLVSMLLPALGLARRQAQVTRVHSDLRQIGLALGCYGLENRDELPATRIGCTVGVQCQLPVELADGGYLPPPSSNIDTPQAHFPDLFDPDHTYRYIRPGPVWYNGIYYDEPDKPYKPRARVWVPSDFPFCRDPNMTWDDNVYAALPGEDPACPLRYAIWSIGPDALAEKFPRNAWTGEVDEERFPLPREYWLERAGGAGLITHFVDRDGHTHKSP